MHGECLEEMDKLIEQGIKVDAIITDIPYGTTACKWDSVIPFDEMWKRLHEISNGNNTPIVLFGTQPFTSELIHSNIKEFKYTWTWNKSRATNHLNSRKQPLRVSEDIIVFYNKQCTYNPILRDREKKNIRNTKNSYTKNNQTIGKEKENYGYNSGREIPLEKGYPIDILNIIQVGTNGNKRLHPTQKPIELMEYLIKTYTNEEEIVLDFTMGSGSTGVACKKLNRKFIGIELDNTYFKIAQDRINKE